MHDADARHGGPDISLGLLNASAEPHRFAGTALARQLFTEDRPVPSSHRY